MDRLISLHRDYLRRLIDLRMDDALRRRVDPSDIVQEAQLVASQRVDDYLRRRPTSFRIWLRRKALERLIDVRRRHMAQKRSAFRDVHLTDASSLAIANLMVTSSPSRWVLRKELIQQVRSAIQGMAEIDREVLLLRHVEELSNSEVAELLDIDLQAARKRHGRAVRRLAERLSQLGFNLEQ